MSLASSVSQRRMNGWFGTPRNRQSNLRCDPNEERGTGRVGRELSEVKRGMMPRE